MIIKLEELSSIRRRHQEETIAFAGGVFDLMHPGHLDLFKHMQAVADIVVVAVSTDERVRQRKGPSRPIHNETTRLQVIDAVRHINYTLLAPAPNKGEVPTVQIMRALLPNIFMSSENSWQEYPEIFRELNVDFKLVVRFSEKISTTHTINRVLGLHSSTQPHTPPEE